MGDAVGMDADQPSDRWQERGPVGDDDVGLSPRQAAIVSLVARGFADKQIARELGVTRRTVRTQLERIYRRHGIHSKPEAVVLLLAQRSRWRPSSLPEESQISRAASAD
jgi:DNA-binding NarL/FixJ family response regulator